ncbi:DUF6369 family protein [Galbibacter sp. CMA-7]|uniref:DUF6369 family protein n=2 Tax=Galbibacter pacificus TaxID=2996052 RepID=A0ABT6FND1_9FLAO|nr:DUF6369 family protein [Galbibacter pacificus]
MSSSSLIVLKKNGIRGFIALIVLLPITNFTQIYHTKFQLSIYYFFFIGTTLNSIYKIILRNKVNKNSIIGLCLLVLFLCFYLFHYLIFIDEQRSVINILKDIKPILLLTIGFLYIPYTRKDIFRFLDQKFINRIIKINFIVCSVIYFLMYKFRIDQYISNDSYFKINETRYLTLGSYFCVFYLLNHIFNGKPPSLKYLFYSAMPVILYTGNRTLVLSILITVLIYYLSKLTAKKILGIVLSGVGILVSFTFLVNNVNENSGLYRFKSLISYDYLEKALSNRFSPFFYEFKNSSILDIIFGKGIGKTFFIPWFVYRDNIDDYNIYIDSLYFTLFLKYGLFSIFIYLIIYNYIRLGNNKNVSIFYMLFFLILSFTNAIVYQFPFLWILILLAFPFSELDKS